MGSRSHLLLLGGGLGGGVIRYQVVIKEKSQDFRSPEVGISEIYIILKISLHR